MAPLRRGGGVTTIAIIAVALVLAHVAVAFVIARRIEQGNTRGTRLRDWLAFHKSVRRIR